MRWNEALRLGMSSQRMTRRSRRSLVRHFGFDWFQRLRLIGFEMLLGVLERIDVIQMIIVDFGFMINVIWLESVNVLLFRESAVLVHGRSIQIFKSVVRRNHIVD
jgi:hypothetical protein